MQVNGPDWFESSLLCPFLSSKCFAHHVVGSQLKGLMLFPSTEVIYDEITLEGNALGFFPFAASQSRLLKSKASRKLADATAVTQSDSESDQVQ